MGSKPIESARRQTRVRKGSRESRSETLQKYLFVLPAFFLFAVFVLLPLLAAVYYGFTRWDGVSAAQWVGLANYTRAFKDEIYLWSYVHVVVYILACFVVEVLFGLVMAVLLNSPKRGFAVLRVLFFSPVVLSMAAAGILWTFIYDYRTGLLNAVLEAVGLSLLTQPWLSNPNTALLAVAVVSGWKYSGFYMIIYLAALKRIPASLYEAAMLDGAGAFRRFFNVTLPLLRETTVITVLLAITGGFAAFDLFYTMTNGQPFNATEIPTTWIVKAAFDRNQVGYGVALTVIMMVVVSVVAVLYLKITRREAAVEY